jgi:hypothetical protein
MMAPAAWGGAAAAVSHRSGGISVERHDATALPEARDAESTAAARRFGEESLGEAPSAILLVPSVVVGLELTLRGDLAHTLPHSAINAAGVVICSDTAAGVVLRAALTQLSISP